MVKFADVCKYRQAQRFIKVFERFGKATPVTYFELGMSVLYELAVFTDEELGNSGFRKLGIKALYEIANRFMKIVEEIGETNVSTSTHLGMNASK